MAYSTLKDPKLEGPFRSAVLDMGHELFVLVVKDSIGHPSLKDFASGKSMGVLNRKFSSEQIKDIKTGLLEFHDLDIAALFQLAKYDCNIPDDWKTEGTLAFCLGKIKVERNEASHKDIHLNREIVERKLDEMKCLYRHTIMKLGEMKCSQGGSIIVYQQYADSIVKRLDALRPKVTNEDLAVKMEHLSSKLDKMPSLENHGNNPSSVDQCDSTNQQIYIGNIISSQCNITSSVDQCDSAKQEIDDINGTIVSTRVEDTTPKYLEEIISSVDSEESLEVVLTNLKSYIESSKPAYYQDIIIHILPSLEKYRHNVNIQHCGLYIGLYITNRLKDFHLSSRLRDKIFEITLSSLEKHPNHQAIVTNGLNIFRCFPGTEMFSKYQRIASAAMDIFHKHTSKELMSTRILSLRLLSKLGGDASGTEGLQEAMASTGILKNLLTFTDERLNENIYDEVLHWSWVALISLIAGCRAVSTSFINENGHAYLQKCLQVFPENGEFLINIMMCLWNALEFQELRIKLMKTTLVKTTYDLLLSKMSDYKVSYRAAGIMYMIASDGPMAWVIEYPTRQQVLDRLAAVIERWDPDTDLNMIQISFKEELRVLQDFSSPELQHMALWNLAYYTKKDAEKYCTMLEEEYGLPLLQKVSHSTQVYYRIKELSKSVIKQCEEFKSKSM